MDKLRIGVLGLGRGYTHLRNFLSLENAEVIGACDRFPMRRERAEQLIAERSAKTRVLPEFDDLLGMKPDAIVVASNGKLQVEHACQALEAGCHVLSEVPGAYTVEECIRLRDTVRGADLKLNRHFAQAILDGRPAPIDVYRGIEYTLPGILANQSAELGGAPITIPDFRCEPFQNTPFWDTIGLPETDPPGAPFIPPETD